MIPFVKDNRNITAAALIGLMLSIGIYSSVYVAEHAEHDCTGESCPVCACLQLAVTSVMRLGGGLSNTTTETLVSSAVVVQVVLIVSASCCLSLIAWKIRLDS